MDTATTTRRRVLIHYHLFKNGGTSIEQLLKASLGKRWVSYDKPEPGSKITGAEMEAWLDERSSILAVSSHQLVPPLPVGNLDVTPVVFLRHPLARVRSAYLFEWQKQPRLAEPKGTLAEYVSDKFKQQNTSIIANFQVARLSNTDYADTRKKLTRRNEMLLPAAMEFIDSLPFVGLVDRFAESVMLMRKAVSQRFPEIEFREYRENVTQATALRQDEINDLLCREIGVELYDELCLRNSFDLQLYHYALGRFESEIRQPGCSGR